MQQRERGGKGKYGDVVNLSHDESDDLGKLVLWQPFQIITLILRLSS